MGREISVAWGVKGHAEQLNGKNALVVEGMHMSTNRKLACAMVALSALTLMSQSASAGSIDLCGGAAGWRATWDPSLDGLVQIISPGPGCNNLANGLVFIEKAATFTQGPNINGVFPTIPITFIQTANTIVNRIIIEDEIITNLTGSPWTDFHMDLIDSGDAFFDVANTAASGGGGPIGFSISPFTQAAFSNGNTTLDIWGGVVPHGMVWNPGSGASNGELWIQVNPHDLSVQGAVPTVFTLKETPTPEPGSLVLLALGAAAVLRRVR